MRIPISKISVVNGVTGWRGAAVERAQELLAVFNAGQYGPTIFRDVRLVDDTNGQPILDEDGLIVV